MKINNGQNKYCQKPKYVELIDGRVALINDGTQILFSLVGKSDLLLTYQEKETQHEIQLSFSQKELPMLIYEDEKLIIYLTRETRYGRKGFRLKVINKQILGYTSIQHLIFLGQNPQKIALAS